MRSETCPPIVDGVHYIQWIHVNKNDDKNNNSNYTL